MPLDRETISRLHAAAISAGLDRDSLLRGLDKRYVASIPNVGSRSAQLLQDLHDVNTVGKLENDVDPMRAWLTEAVDLSAGRPEQALFKTVLRMVDPATQRDDLPSASSAPSTASTEAPPNVRAYISLAQVTQDIDVARRLRVHLAPAAKRQGIRFWSRPDLRAGQPTTDAEKELQSADLVILILTANYLADPIAQTEQDYALAKRDKGLRVIPILARPCAWESTNLKGATLLPRGPKALTSHSDLDSALTAIAVEIAAMAEDLVRTKGPSAPQSAPSQTSTQSHTGTPTAPSSPIQASPFEPAKPGTPLSEIFVRNGFPKLLYIEPAQAKRIRSYLLTLGRGLVVEGPSKIGKTTVLESCLTKYPNEWLDSYTQGSQIGQVLSGGEISSGS
ncbi:MAG: toll/interleukin-1 receptor domain-containing protein [Polyangiaceae bacterium]|nr:toll/interleukin-1 receptor domain-containing protein [Polyangiaceae bacterium]